MANTSETTAQVVIEDFRARFLDDDVSWAMVTSEPFHAGGYKWRAQLELQETDDQRMVWANLAPRTGDYRDPLLPQANVRVRFLNRMDPSEEGFTTKDPWKCVWGWQLDIADCLEAETLDCAVCTRDELWDRVEDFCVDGDLHVEVSFSKLRSWAEEIDPSIDQTASEVAADRLLGGLSKRLFDATPICEQEESTKKIPRPATKRQRVDSWVESPAAVKVTISVPSQGSSGHGTSSTVRFNDAGGARIVMPVASHSKDSRGSSYSRSCKEAHLACSQLMLQYQPKHFTWSLQQRQSRGVESPDVRLSLPISTDGEVVVGIDQELLQRLPLLAGIINDIGRQHSGENDMEGSGGGEATFDAPASACGLACLLLLLEGAASPKQLFGSGSSGPSFAVQTLGMASFLRQNDVEQCAVAAVHAALLFLFRGDLPTGMCTANELVGPSSTLRDHEHEWMQVLETLPSETVKVVLKEHSALWKDLKLQEVAGQVLRLPDVFIEEWLRGNTTLDLRDATLPLSQTLDLIRFLPTHQSLSVLHLSCGSSEGRPDDTLCVLKALNRALATMPRCQLRVLGLHSVQLCTSHLKELTGLCSTLQGNLTGLAISASSCDFENGNQDKRSFFQALSRLTRLRVLALFFPWDRLGGERDPSVLAPLQRLDRLNMLVHENTKMEDVAAAAAVVPGITFHGADSRRFKC